MVSELEERKRDKRIASAWLREGIATIGAEGRQPDMWERVCLAHGISALLRGQYSMSAMDAELALTPPARRSPQWRPPSDPFFARCDLAVLSNALAEVEQEPVRPFPHFGPIVFADARRA